MVMLYWLGDSGRKGLSRCSFFRIVSLLSWLWLVDCVNEAWDKHLPPQPIPAISTAGLATDSHLWIVKFIQLIPAVIPSMVCPLVWLTGAKASAYTSGLPGWGGVKGGHPALGLWVSLNITYFGDLSPKTDGVSSRIASLREGLLSQLHHQAASSFPANKVTCVVSGIEASELAE